MIGRLTAFVWLWCTVCFACSGGGGGGADDVPVDGAADIEDAANDVAVGCRSDQAELVTLLSQYEVIAGETVTVKCSFDGCDDWTPDGLDFLVAGEKGEDYYLEKHSVTFEKPGKYEIACVFEGGEGETEDATPAEIVVQPGVPDEIHTSIAEDEVKAGTKVSVECSAFDEFDNQIYGQFIVATVPQTGVSVAGTTFTPTIVGEYEVVCVLDGLHAGENPASLDVVPNVPAKVYTELTEETMVAGGSAGLACRATDLWDNKVAGFPMVVAVPWQVELTGLTISSWIVGNYEVKCVPQALDWGLFSLYPAMIHVVPAAPAAIQLEVVPHKQTYKVLDKILLQVSVVDEFGNLVPDAELLPVSVEPVEGVVELQPWNFKFTEINQYLFIVKFAGPPLLQAQISVTVDGVGPLLSVDFPERGATVDGAPDVPVTGTVSDQVSGLESFVINSVHVEVQEDGAFSHPVDAAHALNLLVAEAVDQGGEATRTVRSFAYSDQYHSPAGDHADAYIPGAIKLFLAESFVDDGDHNMTEPDDLATLMELVLKSLDFGAFISNPVYDANNYKVFVKNIQLNSPVVQMNLIEGGLTINSSFTNFSADVDAVGSCNVLFVDLCPDVHGQLTIDEIALFASLQMGLDGAGAPLVGVTELVLGVEDVKLDLQGLAGNLLQPIANAVIAMFEQDIQDALKDQLEGMLPELLADIFSQFQLNETITVPPLIEGGSETSVTLETRYSVLDVNPTGIKMHLDARAHAPKKVVHNPLGSIGRGSCAGPDAEQFELSEEEEVAFAFYDDFLNQVLFAAWWGGALNVELGEESLASMAEELAGYGISDPTVSLDFFLSPLISDCNGEQVLRFSVGDVYIVAKFKMLNQPISMGIFASLSGDASIDLEDGDEGPEFKVTIKDISVFEYEIVSITEGFEELIPMVEELAAEELMEEALGNLAGTTVGGLALPEVDISALIPGVPPGTKLSVLPQALDRVSGFTQVTGIVE